MFFQKLKKTIGNQQGRLYEIPIVLCLLAIILAVMIPSIEKDGLEKGLVRTLIGIGYIVVPIVVLLLLSVAIDWLHDRFSKKDPR